jgi:hypothetical protein
LLENLKGRGHLEAIGTDGRMILKWILNNLELGMLGISIGQVLWKQ